MEEDKNFFDYFTEHILQRKYEMFYDSNTLFNSLYVYISLYIYKKYISESVERTLNIVGIYFIIDNNRIGYDFGYEQLEYNINDYKSFFDI